MSNAYSATGRLAALAQWWQGAEGVKLRHQESAALEPWLARCFGYHAMHMDVRPLTEGAIAGIDAISLTGLRIPHAFLLSPLGGEVRARFESLPLESEALDLIVVQHVLEFVADPHGVLRELDRVLVPEGRVVLVSFNPWSYWGLRRLFNRGRSAPWFGWSLGRRRLRDWLALLGYDIEDELWIGHGCLAYALPPLASFMRQGLAQFLPRSGAAYALLARKRVSMPAPIRHRWHLMPGLGVRKAGSVAGQVRTGVAQHTE